MVDVLNENGLVVSTLSEITADLEADYQSIYGADINLDQNSPDGQTINIYAQSAVDLRELLVSVNNSFSPSSVTGTLQDQRYALNGLTRQGGTFTIVPITIVTSKTVTLQGLDDSFNDINGEGYTVQDDAGNEFILIDTVTLTAGTDTVNFRARAIGEVQTTVGTIQTPVTVVLGVTSVNNASGAIETGQDQETDAEFRIRRQQSVSITSSGYLNGIFASLANLDGVTDVKVFENITDSIDADGIPAHGIWCIVEGGSNADIADVIFNKKSAGADMKGDIDIDIETESGIIFTAKFDRPDAEDLYIRFDIQPASSGASFDTAGIKSDMVAALSYNINEIAETSAITSAARDAINNNGNDGYAVNVEISDDGVTWVDYLETASKQGQWTVDATRIAITVI